MKGFEGILISIVFSQKLLDDPINQYYSTCQSLHLLCLSWEKVEFGTHKSLPYWVELRLDACLREP